MFTSKLPPHCMERIVWKLIISMFLILLVPAAMSASPNDACFGVDGGCHNSTSSTPIDRALYDSNPHKIIKCVDCHNPSIVYPESGHGKFIRQLNGSKITGPLLTKYYSQNFSLCYGCHNETKLIGILPGWIYDNDPLAGHENPPTNVSTIGTNFINTNISGKKQNGFWPSNIHWNHLDSYGRYPSGYFDSDMNGVVDSRPSCPTCHNVHGTNYPKMTKNDLAIGYGSDSNGTYGIIGNDNFTYNLNFRPLERDLYCKACHGKDIKYYRNEINLFDDCVSCHIDNIDNIDNISLVNRTAFSQGVHVNISTIGGTGVINNNDCWTCHFNIDMNRSNISLCEDCHTGGGSPLAPTAPKISTHLPAITNYSCIECHSKVINDPGSGIVNVTSHYLQRPSIPGVNYCDYCHGPNPGSPFNATNKTIPEFKHDDPSWNGNSTCRTCHTNSSVIADPNATETSSFHDLTTELGDAYNGTQVPGTGVKADCIICHIQKSTQFVTAPDLPLSHPVLSGAGIGECYGCHGSGPSQPQKLHSIEPTGGGCIGCHSNSGTTWFVNTSLFGNHKKVNTSDGDNVNVTESDCTTCHYESFPMVLGAANSSNTRYCNFCHATTAPIVASLTHGKTDCKWCHAAGDQPEYRYHPGGPKGTAKGKNCLSCHVSANLPDPPFYAPGIVHSSSLGDCAEFCHQDYNAHDVSAINSGTPPTISGFSVTTPVESGTSALVQATISDTAMQIAAAQYRVTNASGEIISWTNMTPGGGRFSSSNQIVYSNIPTSGLIGTYTVNVKGMASAYKTNTSLP
ncbi:MAG: cytochrome c3 family protein, partial [Clostridiales bacterium]|nr:cytochrome c3 family protein [Clostridiales bacterium]